MSKTVDPKHKDGPVPIPDVKDETIHVFLNEQKQGTFLCRRCGTGVTKDLSKIVQVQKAIRIKCKCKCGHVFRVLVERRRNYRKSVDLLGMCTYLNKYGNPQRSLIKILDISTTGLQFSMNSLPGFKVGDKITVEFKLDDREHTQIKENGVVSRILSQKVGLQFLFGERPRKLTLYLMR